MIKLEVNYQVKITPQWGVFLQNLAKHASRILKIKRSLSLSVVFVDNPTIKKINKRYRGINKVTNVLSFEEINEIFICYTQAKKRVQKQQKTLKEEIGLLFIHGLLHLLGFNHQTKKEAQIMEELQNKILKS
ncbi:rRNA maturation RNase YbeY [Patescibacteria group bacterium]|nr:rRNA maturation RNase YbeY [Patescibacteria group bacterium]